MTVEKAIEKLRKTAKEYKAPFISDDFLLSLMPESAKEIYQDELFRLEEILGHEIACLREFMDLANDKLTSMTMNDTLCIGIQNTQF